MTRRNKPVRRNAGSASQSTADNKSRNEKNILYAPQYLRAYMVRNEEENERKNNRGKSKKNKTERSKVANQGTLSKEIERVGAPYAGYCIILDCETVPFDGQQLRFGYFQVRGIHADKRKQLARRKRLTREALDELVEHGFFYDEAMPDAEVGVMKRSIPTLETYSRTGAAPEPFDWMSVLKNAPPLQRVTREQFVRQIIYRYAKKPDALFIGHNLVFDLGALAREFGPANKDYYGGFWQKFCNCAHEGDCGFHPPMLVKKIGKQKYFYGWRTGVNPATKKKGVEKNKIVPQANFLDTITLARALLKPPSVKLEALCELLGTVTKKMADNNHGKPLTIEYMAYNMRDVQATWEVYCKLRAEYRKHNLSKAIWHIYSEASLGVAYLEEMGVPKFLTQHPQFPPEFTGYSMSAYYGGRSEVHIRKVAHGKKPCEVMLVDFMPIRLTPIPTTFRVLPFARV